MTVPYASDLWCHHDASLLALADGASVSGLTDQSGNGRDISVVGSPVTCKSPGRNGLRTVLCNGGLLRTPAADSALNAACTILAVWRLTLDTEEPLFNGNANLWLKNGTVSPQTWQHDGYTFRVGPNQTAGTWHIGTWSGGSDSTPLFPTSVYKRRTSIDQSDGAIYFDAKGPVVGNVIDVPRYGYLEFAERLIYSRHLKFSEECEAAAYLAAKWGLWSPVNAGTVFLLHAGNSTTANSAFGLYNARQLASLKPLEYTEAVSGSNSAAWLARTDENLDAVNLAVSKGLVPILVAHSGHNDGTVSEVSTVITNASGPVQALRTAGARALLVTMSAWNERADKESFRQDLITWTLANWETCADAVYDLGSTAEFGVYTADGSSPPNASLLQYPTYWEDIVHHTAAGHAAKAALLEDVQRALAGNASVSSNTPGSITLTHSHVPTGWSKQWYRSTTAGSRGSALSGATTVPYTDTTGVAGTTYYYSLKLSSTAPVTQAAFSPQVSALAAAAPNHNGLALLGVG